MGTYIEEVIVRADNSDYEREMQQSSAQTKTTTKSWTDSFKSFAGALKAIVAVEAVRYIAQFASAAVEAASSQEEALNKAIVVFGDASDAVTSFAETSAESFGVSETAALAAASTFGNILKVSGLTEEAAASMSVELVKLASDLASFHDIGTDEALEKIRSGLVGETEPLRTVGVLLSEARVQQEAYASGIARTGAKLTEAQKVQARYNVILSDTADAQGDFARTSDSLANQQRTFGAVIEDLMADLGKELLPVMQDLMPVIRDLAESLLPALGAAFAAVAPVVADFAGNLRIATESLKLLKGEMPDIELGDLGEAAKDVFGWLSFLNPNLRQANEHLGTMGEAAARAAAEEEAWASRNALAAHLMELDEATEGASDETARFAAETERAAQKTRDLHNAVLILAGGTLGLVTQLKETRAAEAEVNRLREEGKTGTQEFNQAVLDATESKLSLVAALQEYRRELRESGASQAQVRGKLRELAQQMGITREEFRDALGPLSAVRGQLEGINRLPRTMAFNIEYHVSGEPLHGGLQLASGGIVKAAAGMIVRTPTLLTGEGSYMTPVGRGGEAVIPLDSRGQKILKELAGTGAGAGIDYDRLGRALAQALAGVRIQMDGYQVGRALASRTRVKGGI